MVYCVIIDDGSEKKQKRRPKPPFLFLYTAYPGIRPTTVWSRVLPVAIDLEFAW